MPEFEPLPIHGLVLVRLRIHTDERGFFLERYRRTKFQAAGLPDRFPQENHSRSSPGVLRGLHYQHSPAQGKLVGVARGRIWDVAVDVRPASPTYGQSYACELSDSNGLELWIPAGFAHGFVVLGNEPADVLYKATGEYNSAGEGGIIWNDPELAIAWPVAEPQLSKRDLQLPSFAEYRRNPPDWNLS